ncbi:MAG TPA: SLOG family protein [Drouetiella sp.]
MIVLVCGGRDYGNPKYHPPDVVAAQVAKAFAYFDVIRDSIDIVIQGGATGADSVARSWAISRGIHSAEVKALWGIYQKSSGPIRNNAMLLLKPDLVIAFPGGPGTRDMVKKATARGIEVRHVL